MEQKIRYRQPGKKDKEQVMKLVTILYEKDDKKYIDIWDKGYENYLSHTYVADINGVIAGYVCLGGTQDSLYIGDLCVLPEYRKQGIASKLIDMSIARAIKQNKKYIDVDTHKWNNDSQRLYKKAGFEIIGETDSGMFKLRKILSNNDANDKKIL